jgi:hypothetical protein
MYNQSISRATMAQKSWTLSPLQAKPVAPVNSGAFFILVMCCILMVWT